GRSGEMTLVTTLALATLRGPVPLAKALPALDIISGGRVIAGLGPGSSEADYRAVGVPFEQRWQRFDEAVELLRAFLGPGTAAGGAAGRGGRAPVGWGRASLRAPTPPRGARGAREGPKGGARAAARATGRFPRGGGEGGEQKHGEPRRGEKRGKAGFPLPVTE